MRREISKIISLPLCSILEKISKIHLRNNVHYWSISWWLCMLLNKPLSPVGIVHIVLAGMWATWKTEDSCVYKVLHISNPNLTIFHRAQCWNVVSTWTFHSQLPITVYKYSWTSWRKKWAKWKSLSLMKNKLFKHFTVFIFLSFDVMVGCTKSWNYVI